jgi:putative intracellular protease/amidase
MTVFTDDEEKWAEENILDGEKVLFYPADALTAAGGDIETEAAFESHAVQDRELTTGQNPYSDAAFTDLFLKALDRASSA